MQRVIHHQHVIHRVVDVPALPGDVLQLEFGGSIVQNNNAIVTENFLRNSTTYHVAAKAYEFNLNARTEKNPSNSLLI